MSASPSGPGLAASLRRLLGTLLEIAQVRLELLSIEIESEKLRIFDALIWLVLALLCATTGLLLVTAFVLLLLPDPLRIPALGAAAAIFIVAAIGFARRARRRLASPEGPAPATIDELRRDRETLKAGD